MEKACEFCTLLKAVVYCEADAAHLCLSCDSKVHSANALSNRHPRTLVCEPCGCNKAYVRCPDHQMFMCRECDRRHHDPLSSQQHHHRKVITSYIGCPSPKDLAALWGFRLQIPTPPNQFILTSDGAKAPVTKKFVKRSISATGASTLASEQDLTGAGLKRENTSVILQQILDLERLQVTEGSNNITSGESENNGTSWNMNNKFDLGPEIQDWGVSESFSLQLLDGDSYWQCKSPVQSVQLWPQNLQDVGAYAELQIECFDNSNMPDVDLTFQNFEELFHEDQHLNNTLLNEEDQTCSSLENDSSIDRSDNRYANNNEDIWADSSLREGQSTHIGTSDEQHSPTIKDCPPPIRTLLSRLSSNDNATHTGLSPAAFEQVSCNSHDSVDGKEILLARCKEKNKARLYDKQARNTPRRARSNMKKQRACPKAAQT